MSDRTALVAAVQDAWDGRGLAAAVAALDKHDQDRRRQADQDRELDMAARHVTAALTPVAAHERHTAATDWLGEYEAPVDYRVPMIAEASAWVQRLDPAVLGDHEELAEQARGRAHVLASKYGDQAPRARDEFLSVVAYMTGMDRSAASGLPQIQQLIDPNNAPSQTPMPEEVFDNFAPEVHDYNGGVESDNHASSIASPGAPMLQQLQQQDSGGSGFGSGPEKPDGHVPHFDTSNSYAEVPLGTPGQIPTTPAPTSNQSGGPSTMNPVAGSDQVADDDHLQHQMGMPGSQADQDDDDRQRQASLTPADGAGYRWVTGSLQAEAPLHTACSGMHWPDQRCGIAAQAAVTYRQTYDDVAREVHFERIGMSEGKRAVQGAGSRADLLAHHNRLVTAYSQADTGADDAAVLHGFLAVVRPVLARDFSKKQRQKAKEEGDTLPGTTKLPIKNKTDLKNAERLKGKVKGASPAKVDAYLDREKKELGA